MYDLIFYLIALIIAMPFIATLFVYLIALKRYKHPLKALHISAKWTSILYIISDIVLLNIVSGKQFLGNVLIFLLVVLTAIIVYQWKRKTEIIYGQAFKLLWRFSFLFFVAAYICLLIIGIVQRILI